MMTHYHTQYGYTTGSALQKILSELILDTQIGAVSMFCEYRSFSCTL